MKQDTTAIANADRHEAALDTWSGEGGSSRPSTLWPKTPSQAGRASVPEPEPLPLTLPEPPRHALPDLSPNVKRRFSPLLLLCRLGFHGWARVHGSWREVVAQPAAAKCRRCGRPIESIWRSAYPQDGSRCKPGSCAAHVGRFGHGASRV